MRHNEYNLQVAVCEYINYKNTLFYSDTIAAIKLTAIQGMRNKKVQKDSTKHYGCFSEGPSRTTNGRIPKLVKGSVC